MEVATILSEITAKGIDIRIVQGYRTPAEQDMLYAQGRTTAGAIVTNAKGTPAQSYHCFGLAVDFCLLHKDGKISWDMNEDMDKDGKKDWMEVVETFDAHGWSWGGHWKHPDNPHFEKTGGANFTQLALLQKDNSGYVIFPSGGLL